MKSLLYLTLICCAVLALYSCASKKPYYSENSHGAPAAGQAPANTSIEYSLYLVGGLSLRDSSPVLTAIEADRSAGESGLILLGDVLSIDDLPENVSEQQTITSKEINQIQHLDNEFKDLFLIPGQEEWTSEKKLSHEAISSLDHVLKDVLEKGRFIEPRKGCGTPEVIRIADNTIVVLVDSQWAIESESRSGEKFRGCDFSTVLELKQAIKGIIQSHAGDHIILTMHHPIYANGTTAGNYPFSSHLLPLPILGTIITGIKSLVGSNQHFGHPAYEAYRSAIMSAVDGCKNCVVVSGHEKNLQYYNRGGLDYLVAGSGDEVGYARKGDKSGFSYMSRGYVRADVLTNGQLHFSFQAVDDKASVHTVFEFDRVHSRKQVEGMATENKSAYGDSILTEASTRYGEKKFLRGDAYRKAWSEKINLPVLWLDKVHGGLSPLQLGGGNQTRSLRLENKDGEQYVLRSIDKKVTAVLPPALRGTFAENIVQDGISSSHPYGSLVVPRLAIAAGVYYTHPSIVFVPNQEVLGIYNEEIGNGIYLFEERPGGHTSGFANFGNPEETYNTLDVIEMTTESHKHKVDEKSVLRARLFDNWLGDWDRHDDQVRWAAFEEDDVTIYRPIPRDRDQVFFKNDGLLEYLGGRPYFNPALRRFQEKIDYLPGLVWAGKYFDRSFLHELTEEDFIAEAKQMQSNLTDDVIDAAFLDWPQQIDALDGKEIRSILRARRDHLVDDAREYYRILSKVVAIPGTDDPDLFTISAPDDHHIAITVNRLSGSGTLHPLYERTFSDEATKELQLYGLGKDDVFRFVGDGKPDILVRLIGGTGDDQMSNESRGVDIIAYDVPEGMHFSGKDVSKHLNDKPLNNTYDRTDYKLNKLFHFPFPAYFTDEGFGITYNVWWSRFGFRSDPFKSRHALTGAYFFNTAAFYGRYSGEWRHLFGDLDLGLDAFTTGPTFTQFYYGLGNEYIDYGEKSKYHIIKGGQIRLAPSLGYRFGFGSRLFISPTYHYLDMENSDDDPRFAYTPESGLTPDNFGSRHYMGISAGYQYERLDNPSFPSRGGTFELTVGGRSSLSETTISHGLLSTEASLYIPFDVTGTFVLATHIQADKLFGEYEFFHALTLGGADKLRGFRRDRFAGESRVFQATDLRFRLLNARGMFAFSLGLYGSFDYGRVWYDGDESVAADKWHTAFGGGIFIVPLGFTAFRLGYMVAENDKQINIGGSLRF